MLIERADGHLARGLDHHRAGRLAEAAQCYRAVLAAEPQHARALHLLGTIALAAGDLAAARTLVEAAAASAPDDAACLQDLAEIYRALGLKAEAVETLVRALALDPEAAGAKNNLGLLLHEAGQGEAALILFKEAVAGEPDRAAFRLNLGAALTEADRLDEAAASLDAAVRLAPGDPAVELALGNLAMRRDRADDAVGHYRASARGQPDNATALVNLGAALRETGALAEARTAFAEAKRLDPALAAASWNDGLAALLQGEFDTGWAGWRLRAQVGAVPPHGLDLPDWDGGPLDGGRLFVHAEQGLGDTIQFARFLPEVACRTGGAYGLFCQKPLHAVMHASGVALADGPEGFQRRIALMDLPGLFGTRLDTIPPPLAPSLDLARVARWRARLAALPGRAAALVWRGRPDHANDRRRSIDAAALAPLLARPGITWCGVQPDAQHPGLAAFGAELADMADTAHLLAALDLVVTVDTAVAHLAGTLGRPTWLLLPFAPDWRWLTERADSPWYPSLRLFRQRRPGDWDGVIAAVCAALDP